MVAPAVFHFLLSLKFGDYGLGRQFTPISSHILGVAHLCHAEKMEFLVAVINEIHKFGTCEPAVNQQVIERYLVAYRILHHIQQLDTLAHEILILTFGDMTLLVTFALITPVPLFRGKPLFLAVNLALLAVKREVEHELRAAIAPAQH